MKISVRVSAAAVLVFMLFLLPPYIRTRYEAFSSLSLAREMRKSGQDEKAIDMYRQAISWRSPFNPYPVTAISELERYAHHGLKSRELKLEALRQLRSGVLTSRNFLNFTSYGKHLDLKVAKIMADAEREIKRLTADNKIMPGTIKEAYPYRENFYFQVLSHIAFWGWIASVLYLIFSGFTKDGSIIKRKALTGTIPVAGFYILWLFALSCA